MNGEKYIPLIVEELKKASPEKIILFGSYAYGLPGEESDIDIIVVTPDEFIPETNRERMMIHHLYNQLIKKFRKFMPIDLIVYTKTMYVRLQERGNSFSKEINQKGKVLYDAGN